MQGSFFDQSPRAPGNRRPSWICHLWGVLLVVTFFGASEVRTEERSQLLQGQHHAENGMAALTYEADLAKGFVLSATLDLPEKPTNHGWYCVWLMVGESRGTRELPAMLQVGLMRWDQSRFRPEPFLTTEHAGTGLDFKPVPGIVEGPHRFSIRGDSSKIVLTIDNRTLMSASSREFFHRGIPIYLKIAAEVWAVGDGVSGRVDDIELDCGAVKFISPVSTAAFEDRGLSFACVGKGRWEARGKFEPSLRFLQYAPVVCK